MPITSAPRVNLAYIDSYKKKKKREKQEENKIAKGEEGLTMDSLYG